MSDTASIPGTMRGWAIRAYGDAVVLRDDLPVPRPGPHDILMQMHSAEVGDWDELVRTGAWNMQRPFPLILGLAGAGRIAAIGAAVTGFSENQHPGGVDKALNCVSGQAANDYVAALKDGGKMVDLPGAVSVQRPGVQIIADYVVRGNGARLADLTRLFDSRALRLAIHEIVPFDEAQRALDLVLAHHARGKVVLKIV